MPRLLNNPAHWHLALKKRNCWPNTFEDPVAKEATLKIAAEYEKTSRET